jgi:hypothetical protein
MVHCSFDRPFNSGAKGFTLVAFYVIHHEITNSMEQNVSLNAYISSASQEIFHISLNPKVHYRFDSVENLRERGRWGDPDVDERIVLRWMFRKLEGVVGTVWSWLRIGTGGGHLRVR